MGRDARTREPNEVAPVELDLEAAAARGVQIHPYPPPAPGTPRVPERPLRRGAGFVEKDGHLVHSPRLPRTPGAGRRRTCR